ncbi:CIC_collapsed_G0028480.mRNA.1.CDS.1 [Saccharomyces cerevisiae]|nr:CIC_HP2_G0024350.mRNA.1.CDS.1 [Saccharomyces cerevisiae]CAI5256861.1 ADM_HP2_G0025180.mRNA.1.CDS.1 [Saccharomyces cerevisiae]CAI6448788.1 CIC_HP1_G0025480.mRNA.1.CDS.1 [Saccharomyces cerevisiae]CAI6451004.1 CIC_HP2_G0024350.mRNA.1.CDS.1 [Saccharomyces cerevisiae]CAI6452728.1 ADM_HP2_G0025180.mRNA.1.CDS.1 [Saccharomyces cerevisiae]
MPSDYTSHYPVILIKKLQECIGIVSGTLRWCPPLQLNSSETNVSKYGDGTLLHSAANVHELILYT